MPKTPWRRAAGRSLVVGGAFENRHSVTHQGHLGQVLYAAPAQMLDRSTDLLQRDARIDQPLDHLQDQDVPEAVEPLGPGAGCAPNLGHDQAGTRPVVELPIGDASRAAGDRSTEAQVDRQRRKVALEQQPLSADSVAAESAGSADSSWLSRVASDFRVELGKEELLKVLQPNSTVGITLRTLRPGHQSGQRPPR
jgi:hypothetical protein